MERTLKELFLQAVQERNIDKIRSCINLGADVNVYDNNGFPVLFSAMKNSNILRLFLAQPNIDVNIRYCCILKIKSYFFNV